MHKSPNGGHLQISMQRTWDLSARSHLGQISVGGLKLRAKWLVEKGLEFASDAKRDVESQFSYNMLRAPVAALERNCRDGSRRRSEDFEARFDGKHDVLQLCVPLPLSGTLDASGLMHVLSGWANSAVKSLVGAASGTLLTAALSSGGVPVGAFGVPSSSVPLLAGSFDPTALFSSFVHAGAAEAQAQAHIGLISITAALMFIGSLRGLNKHTTAKQGNLLGMIATALGIISVLASPAFAGNHVRFFLTFFLASVVGFVTAESVDMEQMPELVAGFHSFVGLAAVFVGVANFFHPGDFTKLRALETFIGTAVGSLTFTGSVVAAGKLHGTIPGGPIILPARWALNGAGLITSTFLTILAMNESFYNSPMGTVALLANIKIWGALGANMVLPIGGADMPVVVSLLNAFSGAATSATGFMLSNNLLTITGALVTSSGTLLSDIMCRGINRSMINVLLGGFGTDGSSAVAHAPGGTTQEVSGHGMLALLLQARRIVIVPGYGLAVARCQNKLAEIVAMLRDHGVVVHFAIHPVAGRMPGQMNVLLSDADVPYDIVKEMEDINHEISQYDLAIIIGANDIVNPATQDDPSSPIYGMPAIEVWKARTVVVLKRSMATGYSGVDNPLFYRENVRMLFGDAKQTVDNLFNLVEESQDQIQGAAANAIESEREVAVVEETFPDATHTVGVIRERRIGEKRVSLSPNMVPKLRKMGFSILLEAGAGVAAGFTDNDYLKRGGVYVQESSREVLQQADVVLKVNEPLLEEVQVLQGNQMMAAFWNMFGTEELLSQLEKTPATFLNLALVPRVSRAQKLDALTSMGNIAGYRAVLDAFNRMPRFSRSSVTASGSVPPAKVFIIGAGIAGLSAIATASSMGAKVLANDVRDAAREQVQAMGAEFVAIDAEAIAGEGVGGYATEMGQDFKERQLATYARIVKDCDVVIATAMIPNRAAPVVITREMVASMRKGSVIVDLAAQTGGNCALTKVDQTVTSDNGVTIIAETNYPSSMAGVASDMIGNNFVALLDVLGGSTGDFGSDARWQDPIIVPAVVVKGGRLLWDPNPPPPPRSANPTQESGAAIPPQVATPEEASEMIAWIEAHREELAWAIGLSTVVGLGLAFDVPEEQLTHIGYFVLSLLIGHFTVSGVQPALHTPLVSVTNAISGIIVVGGMLQLDGPIMSAKVSSALAAVFLSSINIVGGFAVTHRMLKMFKSDKELKDRQPARARH